MGHDPRSGTILYQRWNRIASKNWFAGIGEETSDITKSERKSSVRSQGHDGIPSGFNKLMKRGGLGTEGLQLHGGREIVAWSFLSRVVNSQLNRVCNSKYLSADSSELLTPPLSIMWIQVPRRKDTGMNTTSVNREHAPGSFNTHRLTIELKRKERKTPGRMRRQTLVESESTEQKKRTGTNHETKNTAWNHW
jgi:hypothetical protein